MLQPTHALQLTLSRSAKRTPRRCVTKGFTLIELMLYVGIVSLILTFISLFFVLLLNARVKQQTIATVEQEGMQAMQQITQAIRNADGITSPVTGTSASTLTLDMPNASQDPTVFATNGTALTVQEAGGTSFDLTSNAVTVSDVTFINVSRAGTSGSVRVQYTLTSVNISGRNAYDFSQTFYATATRK